MKIYFYFLTFLITINCIMAHDCNYTLSSNKIDFKDIYANEKSTNSINITNYNSSPLEILDITIANRYSGFSYKSALPATIYSNSSFSIDFSFISKQNIKINSIAFIHLKCMQSEFSIPIELNAEVKYKDSRYDFSYNLFDNELKSALTSFVSNHKSFSYTNARKLFWANFDNVNGLVECIYTGKTIAVDANPNFTDLDSKGMNTEHIWPQALGADKDPAQGDIFHLAVSDKTTNSDRANYPYGFVKTTTKTYPGGSKLGKNENNANVFEVRDINKGNVARAIFYFATRYNNPTNFINSQEKDLRAWMLIDTVDAKESSRNDSIFAYQKNRNPFIDHPEFLDRIFTFDTSKIVPKAANLIVSTINLKNYNHSKKSSDTINTYIYNNGNSEAKLIKLTQNDNQSNYSVKLSKESITSQNYISLAVAINSKQAFNSSFTLDFDNSQKFEINIASDIRTSVEETKGLSQNFLEQNYPNPVSDFTTIRLHLDNAFNSSSTLKFYNILGEELFDASNNISWNGENGQLIISRDKLNKFGKVLIYKLDSNNYSESKILFLNN